MKNKMIVYIFAVAFPIIILLSMSFLPVMTYLFGKEIVLEAESAVPRDTFRGDYLSLNLKINEVSVSLFPDYFQTKEDEGGFKETDLYAVLKKEGDYYTVEKMSFKRPNHQNYLWAKVDRFHFSGKDSISIHVSYPIDRFFIPEGTGKEFEDYVRAEILVVKVKVWNGYPLLIGVDLKE